MYDPKFPIQCILTQKIWSAISNPQFFHQRLQLNLHDLNIHDSKFMIRDVWSNISNPKFHTQNTDPKFVIQIFQPDTTAQPLIIQKAHPTIYDPELLNQRFWHQNYIPRFLTQKLQPMQFPAIDLRPNTV